MPSNRQTTTYTQRRPIASGGSETITVRETPETRQNRRSRPFRDYGPTQVGGRTSSGVGLLEAEYFAIIFLLIVQLFIGTGDYGSKMLSFMKRGTLTTILFFLLALIAGAGENAAKITKAIGALVFVAILLTSPGSDIINALDNLFKADWLGSGSASSSSSAPSADTGTQSTTTGAAGTAQANAFGAAERALQAGSSSLQNALLTPDLPKGGVDLITSAIDGITNAQKRIINFFKGIP
jgi:hypothetical protein